MCRKRGVESQRLLSKSTKSIRLFRQSSSCAWQTPRQSFGSRENPSFFQKPQRLFLHYFRRGMPEHCILWRRINRRKNKRREAQSGGTTAKNDADSCGTEERNRASVVSRRQNKSHELYWLEPMKNEERDRPPPTIRVESNYTPRRSAPKLELREDRQGEERERERVGGIKVLPRLASMR